MKILQDLSRRKFLYSISTGIGATLLPRPTLAKTNVGSVVSTPNTTFFNLARNKKDPIFNDHHLVYELQQIVTRDNNLPFSQTTKLQILKKEVGPEEKINLDNLGDVEYEFLHRKWPSRDVHFSIFNRKIPSPKIVRMGNYIARLSRRGFGNVLIYHPDNQKLLKNSDIRDNGKYLDMMKMHPTKNCPKNKMVVIYNGSSSCDGPVQLYQPNDNDGYIIEHTHVNNYVQELKII